MTVNNQYTLTTLAADGAIVIPWGSGTHFLVDTAGFDITGASETGAPTVAGTIVEGTLEIVNTGATTSSIDFTGLNHGLDIVLTVEPGGSEIILAWSSAS